MPGHWQTGHQDGCIVRPNIKLEDSILPLSVCFIPHILKKNGGIRWAGTLACPWGTKSPFRTNEGQANCTNQNHKVKFLNLLTRFSSIYTFFPVVINLASPTLSSPQRNQNLHISPHSLREPWRVPRVEGGFPGAVRRAASPWPSWQDFPCQRMHLPHKPHVCYCFFSSAAVTANIVLTPAVPPASRMRFK